MILVDTSIWIDHIRSAVPPLKDLLQRRRVLSHPVVIGELALGRSKREADIIRELSLMPQTDIATHDEALLFIRENRLGGSGIGYADSQLLASISLTPGAGLWTRDRRLLAAARRLGLDADIEPYGGLQEEVVAEPYPSSP
jgi:predicted nucleic acid-binding protein